MTNTPDLKTKFNGLLKRALSVLDLMHTEWDAWAKEWIEKPNINHEQTHFTWAQCLGFIAAARRYNRPNLECPEIRKALFREAFVDLALRILAGDPLNDVSKRIDTLEKELIAYFRVV